MIENQYPSDPFDLRNALLDDVLRGRKTPDEAEEIAKQKGLTPFARKPSGLNPMNEVSWSLAMTVAWIVWRTPDAVMENWAEYREEWWYWFWQRIRLPRDGDWEIVEGYELRQSKPATLFSLMLSEATDEVNGPANTFATVKEAREALWKALEAGKLSASATNRDGVPVLIPAHEWSYLVASADGNLEDQLRFQSLSSRVEYTDAKFSREAVCRLWEVSRPRQSIASENNVQAWLESIMRASPDRATRTKSDLWLEARERHSLSRRSFDRAYAESVKATGAASWVAPGPRSKARPK